MKRYSKAAYVSALRRRLKRRPDRKPNTLLSGLLSPTEVLERCSADRENLWNARTFPDALTVVDRIAPFWVDYEEDHPRLAASLLRTARRMIANYRRKGRYAGLSKTPTDWIGFLDWTPEALEIVRGSSGGKKLKLTGEEANIEVRRLLKETPSWDWKVRNLAQKISCSTGLVSRCPAWKAYKERRDLLRKKGTIGTVSLSKEMESVLGRGEKNEVLQQLIAEQQEDEQKDARQARLYLSHKKKREGRES